VNDVKISTQIGKTQHIIKTSI